MCRISPRTYRSRLVAQAGCAARSSAFPSKTSAWNLDTTRDGSRTLRMAAPIRPTGPSIALREPWRGRCLGSSRLPSRWRPRTASLSINRCAASLRDSSHLATRLAVGAPNHAYLWKWLEVLHRARRLGRSRRDRRTRILNGDNDDAILRLDEHVDQEQPALRAQKEANPSQGPFSAGPSSGKRPSATRTPLYCQVPAAVDEIGAYIVDSSSEHNHQGQRLDARPLRQAGAGDGPPDEPAGR